MSSYDFSQHEFTPEGSASIDVRLFDQLSCIQDLCHIFASKPSAANAKLLANAASDHLKSARIAFEQFDEQDSEDGESLMELVAYAKGLEMQRVTFLNELDQSEESHFVVADHGYESVLDHLMSEECDCDEYITAADHVYDLYQSSFQVDMDQLSTISSENYEKSPEGRRKEMMRQIGRSALDVAKIGIGVFIGIAAAKKSKLI